MTEKWLNGQNKLESTFENGFYNGTYKSWYPTGKPESEGTYSAGVKTGRWVNYHANGKVMDEVEMDDKGNYNGKYRTYDRQGRLATSGNEYIKGILTGSFVRYFPDGQKQVVQTYVSDTLQKVESFDAAGNLLYSAVTSGDSVYYKSFYADGILFQEGLLVDGSNEGSWKKYNPLGILIEDLNYSGGLQSGPQKKYFGNGNLKEEFSCDSSYIVGVYKSYFINGPVQITGTYLKEGADGEWISFHRNDTMETKSFYKQGVLCGRSMTYNPEGMLVSEVFYNDKGKAVRSIDYDRQGQVTDDFRYNYGNHEFTASYPNGKVKSVIHICDNVNHGLQEEYFPNGQLKSQITYLYGKPDGNRIRYDYRGNRETQCNYTLGELEGEYKLYNEGLFDYQMFYENGQNNGKNTGYYRNGKIAREISMEEDERNGISDYYAPDGSFMYRVRYQNNVIQGICWKNSSGGFVPETPVSWKTSQVVMFYPSGKVSARISLKNGLYHGKFISYYPDGKTMRESEYMFDESTGVTREYYPDGQLLQVATYLNDELNGPYTTYRPNGKMKLSGSYTANSEHGEWHVYDESGRETETLFYQYGDLYDLVKK
jgi:antitoxin component YwqK of YwqJK toxin-antitoxin module